jgi:hypothetical protein
MRVSGSLNHLAVKLALDDKQEILRLYRESDANHFNLFSEAIWH